MVGVVDSTTSHHVAVWNQETCETNKLTKK